MRGKGRHLTKQGSQLTGIKVRKKKRRRRGTVQIYRRRRTEGGKKM